MRSESWRLEEWGGGEGWFGGEMYEGKEEIMGGEREIINDGSSHKPTLKISWTQTLLAKQNTSILYSSPNTETKLTKLSKPHDIFRIHNSLPTRLSSFLFHTLPVTLPVFTPTPSFPLIFHTASLLPFILHHLSSPLSLPSCYTPFLPRSLPSTAPSSQASPTATN